MTRNPHEGRRIDPWERPRVSGKRTSIGRASSEDELEVQDPILRCSELLYTSEHLILEASLIIRVDPAAGRPSEVRRSQDTDVTVR